MGHEVTALDSYRKTRTLVYTIAKISGIFSVRAHKALYRPRDSLVRTGHFHRNFQSNFMNDLTGNPKCSHI